MRGLESLGLFIYRTATAQDQNDVFEALSAKIQHSKHVAESFRQTGLAATMFEWMDVWDVRELDAGETVLSLKAYQCHGLSEVYCHAFVVIRIDVSAQREPKFV